MLRSFVSLILMLVFHLLIVGCDSRQLSDDPLEEGIQKIDQGHYDEAIVFLQNLANRDPRPEVRVALASAYVGRSGVEFADYWEIVRSQQREPIDDSTIQRNPEYLDNKEQVGPIEPLLSREAREDLDKFLQMLTALNLYRERIETLPYVEKAQREDLREAIRILEGISTPGGRLYRAILSITLLRADLDDGFDLWKSIEKNLGRAFSNPLETHRFLCTPITGDFVTWALERFQYTQEVVDDLSFAFPSDAADFQTYSDSVLSLQDELPNAQASLLPESCQ